MEQFNATMSAPHIKGRMSTDRIMKCLVLALIPAGIHGVYRYGLPAGLVILSACMSSVIMEFLFEKITKKPITVMDCSAILNGLLVAYCLPPSVEWYIGVYAGIICALIKKLSFLFFHRNIVSPVIFTRLLFLLIFPVQMSTFVLDGVSTATPLAFLKANESVNTLDMILGNTGGCIGETSALLLSLGAIFLIAIEIIDFRVCGMYLFSFAAFMALFGGQGLSSYFLTTHLAGGGFMLALWYIAPDYSTLPMTKRGRWVYGTILGIFTGISRVFGTAPENLCFAILAANLLVPVIEKLTASRPFGVEKGML